MRGTVLAASGRLCCRCCCCYQWQVSITGLLQVGRRLCGEGGVDIGDQSTCPQAGGILQGSATTIPSLLTLLGETSETRRSTDAYHFRYRMTWAVAGFIAPGWLALGAWGRTELQASFRRAGIASRIVFGGGDSSGTGNGCPAGVPTLVVCFAVIVVAALTCSVYWASSG